MLVFFLLDFYCILFRFCFFFCTVIITGVPLKFDCKTNNDTFSRPPRIKIIISAEIPYFLFSYFLYFFMFIFFLLLFLIIIVVGQTALSGELQILSVGFCSHGCCR